MNATDTATLDLIEPIRAMHATATGASPKVKMSQMPDLHNPATVACDLTTSSMVKRKWNPPMLGPLPPTFLRLSLNEVISHLFDQRIRIHSSLNYFFSNEFSESQ